MRILFAWLSNSDVRATKGEGGDGPIASAVRARSPDELVLLSSQAEVATKGYASWVHKHAHVKVVVHVTALRSPTHLGDIHEHATQAIAATLARHPRAPKLVYHLSPGTSAMAAVWILLGKTRYPGTFLESSREHGVHDVDVPFSLSAELLPDLLRGPDAALERYAEELPPAAPEFAALVHRSVPMKRLLGRARRVALRSVPVLIEGESGSGKELLARAMHHASPRAEKPFVAVNCGAIPGELIEAELFGHERGAFTGADRARPGHFREAHGGTLFLDEIGELPLLAQVRLLRVLQEGEVLPIGASRAVKVDVRVMAATNRRLVTEVAAGRFRSDLYYRLAVAVLALPALRERAGDLDLLIDLALSQINIEFAPDPGYAPRRLAPAARAVLHAHRWPGNVRELWNTIRRAALWSTGVAITVDDAREALLEVPEEDGKGGVVDLPVLLGEVARKHMQRALLATQGNKSLAARQLGLASHQTLSNWMRRYGVAGD